MKNNILRITSFVFTVLFVVTISSCVKDDLDSPPAYNMPIGETVYISDLWKSYTNIPQKFEEEQSIFGVVTMGEENGALYKEAFIRDQTGSLKLEFSESSTLVLGDSIHIQLKGGRYFNDNDMLVIDSLDIVYNVKRISAGKEVTPRTITISDLNTGAYKAEYIKLENVQFADSELGKTWATTTPPTTENRTIEDCDKKTTIVRTSGYANFANDLLPEGNGSLIAVASSFRGTSQLLVAGPENTEMTGTRCDGGGGGGGPVDPVDVVDEDFSEQEDFTDISINGWTVLNVSGDRNWQGKTFDSEVYAQATGYNSGLSEMETWMITPPVTNISEKVLSFRSAKAFWSHTSSEPLTVLISTDFVGDNFENATWTELDVNIANENSSDHAWIESGEVDLSSYSGNAAIAFKYVGSDTESTSIRIDDVLIDVSGGGGNPGGVDPVDEINEDFGSMGDYDDIDVEGWTNIKVTGDRAWIARVFDNDPYAQSSGYNSGLSEMETWLITPPVKNIQDKTLSFKSAIAYWAHGSGHPGAVLVSEDFNGENFETATWTEIDVTIAQQADGDHTWVESGEYDLSAFSGNAAIAFRYIGSDSESTTFRVDNVVVTNGSGGGGGGNAVESINEDFSSVTNYEDINLEGWVNINAAGDRKWQGKEYESDKYAQATGYNSGLDEMECWLITPLVSDIGSKSLSLKTAMAYWAHGNNSPLTIYVSEDYDGENYETATWTEINITLANASSGDHNWVESGAYDLSNFDGDAAIAFKFVGSATESTSFRLDDIVVE